MKLLSTVAAATAALILVSPATAQHGGGGATPPAFSAPAEATQFDFLIGQWELVVTPKVSGLAARIHGAPRLLGTWKAWRAFDGFGIEDELRIVDGSGNPSSLSHALRVYSTAERRWLITGLDVYRSRFSAATAEWNGTVMTVVAKGTDATGKAIDVRSRFSNVTPTSFLFQQDRSSDGGKTWDDGVLKIQAKRAAPKAAR